MPTRRFYPVALSVTLVVSAPIAVLAVWPQILGLQVAFGVAHLIAFRSVLAIAWGVVALVAALVAALRRRWAIAAGIALVAAAASVANAGVLIARGSTSTLTDSELTVVTWNTEGGAVDPHDIARLLVDVGADIATLPETHAAAAAEVVRLLAEEGEAMTAHTTDGDAAGWRLPTSLIVSDDLGEYARDASAGSTPGLPSGVWRPLDGGGPTIVAVHPRPPIPMAIAQWRAGLRWVAEQCDSPEVIVAGDMNATADHLSGLGEDGGLVGSCRDAATAAGAGAVGTWPTAVPIWLGAPIDRVLVGSAFDVRAVAVLHEFDRGGSDHRPVVAALARRSPATG